MHVVVQPVADGFTCCHLADLQSFQIGTLLVKSSASPTLLDLLHRPSYKHPPSLHNLICQQQLEFYSVTKFTTPRAYNARKPCVPVNFKLCLSIDKETQSHAHWRYASNINLMCAPAG